MAELKHPAMSVRILLGGGIGSGKSVAGMRFEQLGATVVEADHIGHEVLERDGQAFESVIGRWPSVVVGGRVDRGALARLVFADPTQLTELEEMTHPAIIKRVGEIAVGEGDLVVEIPLILDVPGDWVKVFVDVDEDIRAHRAIDRGADETDVRKRMASQPSRDEWLAWRYVIVDNNGAVEDLNRQIDSLWYGLRTTDYGLHRADGELQP